MNTVTQKIAIPSILEVGKGNIHKPELLIKIISNMLCMAHQVVFNKFKFSLIK